VNIFFNFSNFDWEVCHGVGSTHSPGFGFIAYWQNKLEIVHPVFSFRIGQNSKGVVEKKGMITKWESVKVCYLCVMCRSFLFLIAP